MVGHSRGELENDPDKPGEKRDKRNGDKGSESFECGVFHAGESSR